MFKKINNFSRKCWSGLKRDVKSGFTPGWIVGAGAAGILLPAAAPLMVSTLVMLAAGVVGSIAGQKAVKSVKNHKGSFSKIKNAQVTAPLRFVSNKAKSGLGNVSSIGNKFKAAASKNISSLKSSIVGRSAAPKPPKTA